MNLTTTIKRDPTTAVSRLRIYEDPLDEGKANDVAVVTTWRGLTRLALMAAETGARFQREGLDCDPMAWLLAPRRMFEGHNALEACLNRAPCIRALVSHGLSIGMDANLEDLEELVIGSEPVEDTAAGLDIYAKQRFAT